MAKVSKRQRQIADLIHRTVAKIVQFELANENIRDINIISVDASPDLKSAKIFFGAFEHGRSELLEKELNQAAGFIRKRLATAVSLRYTPALKFFYDYSLIQGERVSHLLKDVEMAEDVNEEALADC